MKTIKLSEWCDKTGVKYLTAWRWFKSNQMPVYAYQTESGTILVEDDDSENTMNNGTLSNNEIMSFFLKKTVEFSNKKSSIEDFAAFILSNFTLKNNVVEEKEKPKYSKNKPKSEDILNHFRKFIPEEDKRESIKRIKNLINNSASTVEIMSEQEALDFLNSEDSEDLEDLNEAHCNDGYNRTDGYHHADGYHRTDLEAYKEVFENVLNDKDFKVFTHNIKESEKEAPMFWRNKDGQE